jgi:hypothetical protein
MLMNRKMTSTTFVALICISIACRSQDLPNKYFEGSITYKIDIVLKTQRVDSISLRKLFGTKSVLYFKEGNFVEEYQNSLVKHQLYRKEDNKLYFRKHKTDTTLWMDCSKSNGTKFIFYASPKKEKIVGVNCSQLTISTDEKIVTDYYNQELFKTNPVWFKDFKLDNQNTVEQKEKAVCLKHKIEYPDFIIIATATSYTKKKINDSVFELGSEEILVPVQ